MNLTIALITARTEPHLPWFFWSLERQLHGEKVNVIVVDFHHIGNTVEDFDRDIRERWRGGTNLMNVRMLTTRPKPTVWQGEHRLTKEDWWAMSNARNTALCLCKTDYIVWVDDRCVLSPVWLEAVKDAMGPEPYAVCGNYEKRHNMRVENGLIIDPGTLDGKDSRDDGHGLRNCFGQFWGGTYGMPTEWALEINGFSENLDSLGSEDYICGMMLVNNGYVTKYDPRLKVIQDRTPGETGPVMKRSSKERFPNDPLDKGHKAIERFGQLKSCDHQWNLRAIRENCLNGIPFPHHNGQPDRDWFDGQLISEFV